MEFIICGDIKMNYLHCHNRRQQLDSLLAMYILKKYSKFSYEDSKWKSTVNFPTRILNGKVQ